MEMEAMVIALFMDGEATALLSLSTAASREGQVPLEEVRLVWERELRQVQSVLEAEAADITGEGVVAIGAEEEEEDRATVCPALASSSVRHHLAQTAMRKFLLTRPPYH